MAEEFNLDDEKLEQESRDARNRKIMLNSFGAALDALSNAPSAAEVAMGMKRNNQFGKQILGGAADAIQDPLERRRKAFEYMKMKREARKGADEDKRIAALKDPNSTASKAYMFSLKNAGIPIPEGASAYDLYQQGYNPARIAEIKAQSQIDLGNKKALLDYENQLKSQGGGDPELLVPGYGQALTKDDAKNLKSAIEMKSKFDQQIQEMIDLRKKYGSEVLNREAVERGKQLSKDLLLTYKNLAKLGVLSKADEAIIDQIIPKDPLGFTPYSMLTGQDPIMKQLESFRKDSDNQFATSLETRLRDGAKVAERFKKDGGSSGLVEVIAPDGTRRRIPKSDLDRALAAGGKLADDTAVAGR